jgi:putative aldouronate transport system substrate-binding protein
MAIKSKKNLFKAFIFVITLSLSIINLTGLSAVKANSRIDTSEPVQLRWYVPGNGDQPDIELVENEINKYLKDKINATLSLKTFTWGDDYNNHIAVMLAAGEPFDMCFTSNWTVNYRNYTSFDVFRDLTDMLDTYAPKTKALLGSKILKGAEVNGRVYAIPTYRNDIVGSQGILLNKTLVEKYKIDTSKIKKLEDLEAIFKSVKAKAPKVIDFYPFDYTGSDIILNVINYEKLADNITPGAILRDGKSTKVVNEYETPKGKSLFALMNKWYKQGYISKSSNNMDFFKKNKTNILAFYSNITPFIKGDFSDFHDIEVLPVELTKPHIQTNDVTALMQAIPATSKNPERALMFLELVNTDVKLSNMINFGIEGIHYKKTGARTITPLQKGLEGYSPRTDFIFGNQSIVYSVSGTSTKYWSKVKETIEEAVPSPLLGFSFNSDPVRSQIDELDAIVNKYYANLSMGKIDPAVNLPKMNKELNNAGLQKVLTEMQKQVDGFIKSERK